MASRYREVVMMLYQNRNLFQCTIAHFMCGRLWLSTSPHLTESLYSIASANIRTSACNHERYEVWNNRVKP